MTHIVDLKDVESVVRQPFHETLVSSMGKGSSKRLLAAVTIQPQSIAFEVASHGQVVYSGDSLADAVKAYNACP